MDGFTPICYNRDMDDYTTQNIRIRDLDLSGFDKLSDACRNATHSLQQLADAFTKRLVYPYPRNAADTDALFNLNPNRTSNPNT